VVEPVNELHTRLRIDAVFVESGRRRADASDGSVETAEFKAIQDKLQQLQLAEQEATAASAKREEEMAAKARLLRERQEEAARIEADHSSIRDLEERIHHLRQDVEVRVKEQNTELKSAPFNKAPKLDSLAAGTELVVAIVTPYWFGVETADGQRGWLRRDQVEPLP
jgi:glucosamine 6-phosphate synthetase-like amidotransferase/phosphosugar isomerase protein